MQNPGFDVLLTDKLYNYVFPLKKGEKGEKEKKFNCKISTCTCVLHRAVWYISDRLNSGHNCMVLGEVSLLYLVTARCGMAWRFMAPSASHAQSLQTRNGCKLHRF